MLSFIVFKATNVGCVVIRCSLKSLCVMILSLFPLLVLLLSVDVLIVTSWLLAVVLKMKL